MNDPSEPKAGFALETCRAHIDATVSDDDWKALWQKLAELAVAGNLRAMQLLISYRWGPARSKDKADAEAALPPIRWIEPNAAGGLPLPDETAPDAAADSDGQPGA